MKELTKQLNECIKFNSIERLFTLRGLEVNIDILCGFIRIRLKTAMLNVSKNNAHQIRWKK